MKKIAIIFAFLCFTTASYAQFTVGPKIGISSSKLSVDEAENIKSGDSKVGFHAGAFARIELGIFYLQPEVTFTSSGGEIRIDENAGQTYDQVTELTYNKLDVPVLAGLKFGEFFRVNVGPVFTLVLSQDARNVDSTIDEIESDYKNAVMGYQAGVGVDIGNLTLDLRYEGNLSTLCESVEIGNTDISTDMRNNQFLFSVGFKLF